MKIKDIILTEYDDYDHPGARKGDPTPKDNFTLDMFKDYRPKQDYAGMDVADIRQDDDNIDSNVIGPFRIYRLALYILKLWNGKSGVNKTNMMFNGMKIALVSSARS